MSLNDAHRWNRRYLQEETGWQTQPRDWLVDHFAQIPGKGLALDLAMGLGENSGYLIKNGWQVVGADISSVAVKKAKKKYPSMLTAIVDLTDIIFARHSFDLVLNFYFLQRDLLAQFHHILKPGGYLLMETLTMPIQEIKPDIPVEYLLHEGELRNLFASWNILDYREGWYANSSRGSKAIASIFAQSPTS